MSRLTLKHNNQQHLELLLPVDRVGMPRGHHDGVALVQLVGNAVDRDAADAVQAGDERVAAGGVRADLLILVEGEERDAQRVVLRKRAADDLLDACLQYFPPEDDEQDDDDVIQVAIIGKPNVGKSSLTNRILGEQRVIVSNVAGTTRDAIDSYFENETGKFNFIDTAGMRKKSKVDDSIEKYSVLRATMAIERSDVCLILIDATEGVTEQDTKVAGLAHEAGKACIIVVNKWDLVEKDGKTMDRMREDIRRDLSYMTYAPILFISALTGQRVTRLFELIQYVNNQATTRITTGMLNSVLADAQTRVQPPTDKGRRLKIYYMTQVGIKPPHFVVFCNDKKLFHFSYRRYLENQIRSVFGLEGTPIIMSIRQKGEEDA